MTRPKLLTVEEVAEILRVSKMTVYRLAEKRELPSVKVGRSIRIVEDGLDMYLRRGDR